MKVRKLIEAYLDHVKANHSHGTFISYRGRLKHVEREFGDRKVKKIKPHEILSFLDRARKENGEPYAPDSKRLLIVATEMVQKYAVTIGELRKPSHAPANKLLPGKGL